MQLHLEFPDLDATTTPSHNHCEDSYIQEFELGDFSHAALQTKYSANEIFDIFLTSKKALDLSKMIYLQKIGKGIDALAWKMDNEYKEYAHRHNDELRDWFAYLFAKEDPGQLQERGLDKFHRYNDLYREMYGGKHFNNTSVADRDHEWHEKYLMKRKEHIQGCISHLIVSHIRNPAHIITYYMSVFDTQEFIEAVNDMDLPEDKKNLIIEQITPKKR